MIDIAAARALKQSISEGFDKSGMRAAEALIASIESGYGDLDIESGDLVVSTNDNPLTINDWTIAIHEYAKEKGWWDGTPDVAAKLMLMATEVHEAFEEWRSNRELTETYYEDDKPNKPEGVPTELADVVIRILDFCGWAGIDLQEIMETKHAYNLKRPYRHGGKRV